MDAANTRASRWVWLHSVTAVTVVLAALSMNFALDICVSIIVTNTQLGWPALPMPPLTIIGQNCGDVHEDSIPSVSGGVYDPDQGELCLWRAYTACHAATLIVDYTGIDVGSVDAITVQPRGGRCAVTDRTQEDVWGPWATGVIHQCAGIQRLSTGKLLLFGCGNPGEFALPPRPPQQVGHVCGILSGDAKTVDPVALLGVQTSVTDIEACFWQAYRSCAQPATLVYEKYVEIDNGGASGLPDYARSEHTLVGQPSHGSCALTDAVAVSSPPPNSSSLAHYTCASLSRTSDGSLVARDCGAEGQIIISSTTVAPPN